MALLFSLDWLIVEKLVVLATVHEPDVVHQALEFSLDLINATPQNTKSTSFPWLFCKVELLSTNPEISPRKFALPARGQIQTT